MFESGAARRWPRGTGSAGRMRGGGGGGGAAVGRGDGSERWRAGAGLPVWARWGRAQAASGRAAQRPLERLRGSR
eukprot:5702230-Prymnesium_polylepis.1